MHLRQRLDRRGRPAAVMAPGSAIDAAIDAGSGSGSATDAAIGIGSGAGSGIDATIDIGAGAGSGTDAAIGSTTCSACDSVETATCPSMPIP